MLFLMYNIGHSISSPPNFALHSQFPFSSHNGFILLSTESSSFSSLFLFSPISSAYKAKDTFLDFLELFDLELSDESGASVYLNIPHSIPLLCLATKGNEVSLLLMSAYFLSGEPLGMANAPIDNRPWIPSFNLCFREFCYFISSTGIVRVFVYYNCSKELTKIWALDFRLTWNSLQGSGPGSIVEACYRRGDI